jgi:peroxisomal 2,4-dienoyl-CoA reductase
LLILTEWTFSAVPGDVRNPADVENAVKKTVEMFGRLDYLINGAAGNFLAPFHDLSYNAFKTVIEIDLLGKLDIVFFLLPIILLIHIIRYL